MTVAGDNPIMLPPITPAPSPALAYWGQLPERFRPTGPALVATRGLADELLAARQALWDVYAALGFDTDGDATPKAVVNLCGLVLDAAKEFRRDYDEAINESHDNYWLRG